MNMLFRSRTKGIHLQEPFIIYYLFFEMNVRSGHMKAELPHIALTSN